MEGRAGCGEAHESDMSLDWSNFVFLIVFTVLV